MATNGIISSFLWLSDIPVYVYTTSLSIHLSMNNLSFLYVLAIVNSAVMNIGVHVSFQTMVFSRYMPRSGIAGSYGSSFSCLRNLLTDLHSEVKWLDHVRLFVTPWTVAYKAPFSMEFSRQEYWSGLLFPSPGDLPNPGIEPWSPTLQADTLPSEPPGKPCSP